MEQRVMRHQNLAVQRHLVAAPLPYSEGFHALVVTTTEDGIQLGSKADGPMSEPLDTGRPDLVEALNCRPVAAGWLDLGAKDSRDLNGEVIDHFLTKVLARPSSARWREAASMALLSDWCTPLLETGMLPSTALGALRAETRTVHRQLVPVWRRRTQHGRVLSLDAALGDGLSLYDLVAADVDLLTHATGGVFEDERLNTVLRGLTPAERQVVIAYALHEGTTWSEAAAAVGVTDSTAFGERVRRKAKRLAAEQRRRTTQRLSGSRAQKLRG
jgi:DNA-directed RNA polymerase specialized sigma24 family protein